MAMLASLLAAGALVVEPELRSGQTARADSWQQVWSNLGVWCEGCCSAGLCCDIPAKCRHDID